MVEVLIADELFSKIPSVELSCIECDVIMVDKDQSLWELVTGKVGQLASELEVGDISQLPAILASRKAYKACGKDPARYRLSAEALLRRVVKRGEIYQINNAVDLLNLVSISTGFSIGGYDVSKIEGSAVFGIGKKEEPYSGIGRGDLNIEFLPVFRDDKGAFGTPTSDSQRTAVSSSTQKFLMIIIDYASSVQLKEATQLAVDYLQKYANAKNIEQKTIKYNEGIL